MSQTVSHYQAVNPINIPIVGKIPISITMKIPMKPYQTILNHEYGNIMVSFSAMNPLPPSVGSRQVKFHIQKWYSGNVEAAELCSHKWLE